MKLKPPKKSLTSYKNAMLMENSQTQKLELLEWLANIEDTSILQDLMEWKKSRERISIEQYNKELEEANNRVASGEYISNEDVKKESESW